MDGGARQLGHAALELLAEDWSIPIMRELLGGSLRPRDLEERLPGASHTIIMRRLGEMLARGIVRRRRYRGLQRRTQYALTRSGWAILEDVVGAAERWEREWASENERRSWPRTWALRVIGHEPTREIMVALAERPLAPKDIQGDLAGLGRSTLRERLAGLVRSGILVRHEHHGLVTYELTDRARALALLEIAAARWEWEWIRPRALVAPRDIAGVLRMFAPAASISTELDGLCRLHIDADIAEVPDVYLAAVDGEVVPAAPGPAQAGCHATPQAWCDLLLLRRFGGLSMSGNRALILAMLGSVSAALAR